MSPLSVEAKPVEEAKPQATANSSRNKIIAEPVGLTELANPIEEGERIEPSELVKPVEPAQPVYPVKHVQPI